MEKILITGGSGFIGTNLIDFLIKKKYKSLINIDIKKPKNLNQINYWKSCDILNFNKLNKIFSDFSPTIVIHLAARTDLNENKDLNKYNANIKGVENIVECSKKITSLGKILIFSSKLVNKSGDVNKNLFNYSPINLYGESKVLTEKITIKSNLNWTILRPTSIWGPWFGEPYRNFFNYINKGLYFSLPKFKSATKTFGFVYNTCYQIHEIMISEKKLVNNKIFYLGDYKPLNIFDWANSISIIMKNKNVICLNHKLFYKLCIVGDYMRKIGFIKFPLSTYRYQNMTNDDIIDLSSTKAIIKKLPFENIDENIKITLDNIKNNTIEKNT